MVLGTGSLSPCAAKRSRGDDADRNGGAEGVKKTRPAGEHLRVSVKIDVLKDGEFVSEINLPDMKPLQVCTLGRSPQASIPLQHPSLSRIHAQLEVGLRGELQLVDRGSGVILLLVCMGGYGKMWPGHLLGPVTTQTVLTLA